MAADRPVSGKVVTLVESRQWSVSEEFRGVTVQLFGSKKALTRRKERRGAVAQVPSV